VPAVVIDASSIRQVCRKRITVPISGSGVFSSAGVFRWVR
jgi:hypothetical protein